MSTDSYKRLEKIGEGTYGIVFRALHKQTKRIVALKKIRPENEDEGISATTLREISILKGLNSNRIIKILDVMCNEKDIFIVYEFAQTDLRKLIDSYKTKFDRNLQLKLTHQIIEGISYLHTNGIIHRDLKPQNILIDKNQNIKLADFGLSRRYRLPHKNLTKDVITLWYRPPELLLGCKQYSTSIDIWSLGCIIFEILEFKPLFPGDSEIDQIVKIFTILGTPTDTIWPNIADLTNYSHTFPVYKPVGLDRFISDKYFLKIVGLCLTYDPIQRVCAVDLLNNFRESV